MAKHGGGFGGMGGFNPNILKQAQKMQSDMLKTQEELETREYTAQSGGGAVSVTISGSYEVKSLTIKPEVIDPEDAEMLQDLIISALNAALKDNADTKERELSKFGAGLGLF